MKISELKDSKTMRISDLVKELEDFRAIYGDCFVAVDHKAGAASIEKVRLVEGGGNMIFLQTY